ncbi:hypothetical protein [Streptomyces sp. NPDC048057]|uniref:phage tail protein n=1 Tax=Streptomyces sp. NPDC048057 TaxID=3155628 RepID=UPI003409F2E0
MPAGQVIGRVSVRVLPDTSNFRRDTQKQLDRIERQLRIDVQVKPNMDGFLREMLTEVQKINQQNRASSARKIRLYTRIDTSTMAGELAKAIRQYNAKARSGAKVQLPTQLTATDVDLKISDQSLRDMSDQLKEWRDKNSPLKIRIEPDVSAASSAATSARLRALTRPRTVSIIPHLDNAAVAKVAASLAALSGIRVLNNLFTRFSNILRNLDQSVPIIGTLASAIAGLAALALTSASNLFALSASLAQIGAVALTLPGILGGFAVGIGVTIAALRDFNKEVPQVKKALSALQNQISANFWEQARQPIRDLVDNLLPRFAQGFRATATEIGKFFGSFATDLTAALNPELVDKMFGYLNESIKTATGGTKIFSSIIAQLGEVGASYLPNLAGWFVNISRQFDNWLKKKGQLGLRKEIDEGIQSLKDLGGVLFETGGILAGLSRAATEAGGSTLGNLRETLKSIHQTVDSPGFQRGLVDVFRASHVAMANLSSTAGPAVKRLFIELGALLTTVLPHAGLILGTAFGAIADALAQPAVTEGVVAVFDGLLKAVQLLAPAMAPLGLALGAVLQVVSAMLPAFAALVSAALIPLSNAFAQLAPMVIPIIELLAGALTSAVVQLSPLVMQLAAVVAEVLGTAALGGLQAILPLVSALFTRLLAAVTPIAVQLGEALAPILISVGEYIAQVGAAAMPLVDIGLKIISAVLMPLIPLIQQLVTQFLPQFADAFSRLYTSLQPALQALLSLVNLLMPVLAPAIGFIVGLLLGSLVGAINGVALVFEGLTGVVTGVWDIIVGVIKIAWGLIEGLFTGNFSTLSAGWSQFWSGIWTLLKGVWDTILGALVVFLNIGLIGGIGKALTAVGGLFKSGWKYVTDVCTGAFNAIRGYVGVFLTGVRGLVSDGLNVVKGFFASAWTSIRSTASTALSKLVSTIGEWIGKAVSKVKELPGKAKEGLGSLGSTLATAGKDLIRGFIDGIGGMFGSVKSKLGDLTNKLKDWKGPESLDRVLLVGAGQLVIDGFIKGLESRYDAVRKSLQGLTADIGNTEISVPSVGQIGVSGGVSSAVGAALAVSNGGGSTKILNYYAAPGSSLGSEEDLFAAANRARFGW